MVFKYSAFRLNVTLTLIEVIKYHIIRRHFLMPSSNLSSTLFTILFFIFVTALDPLFWVAHGAMERTFQKSVFSGIFTDMIFKSSDKCSGHDSSVIKFWLKGFYFIDESISAESLSNEELTEILDPTSDQYKDLINFVYDTSSFGWCADSDSWFSKS